MQLLKSITNNLKFISYHFYTWLFNFFIIYIGTIAMRAHFAAYFKSRTINEDLMNGLDIAAFGEYIMKGYGSSPESTTAILTSLIIMGSLMFLIVGPLIDAGFIAVLHSKDKNEFWPSLKGNGMNMILLKVILLIPNLIMIAAGLFAVFIIASPSFSLMSISIALFLVGTFFLLIYKLNDLAKYHLIVKNKGLGNALSFGFSNVFGKFSDTLQINAITALLFTLGHYIAESLDMSIAVQTAGAVTLMFILRQLFILLKQILRYSYLDAIISQNPFDAEDIPMVESNDSNDDGYEFDELIKET